MFQIFLAQFAFIVALLIWLWVLPARSLVPYLLQLAVVILALVGAAGVGIWLFPPWWTPFIAILIAGSIAMLRLRKWNEAVRRRTLLSPVLSGAALTLMALACTFLITRMTMARRQPAGVEHVELEWPLEDGTFLVVNGGNSTLINAHQKSMDTNIVRLRPWRGNGHAVDIVAIDAMGRRSAAIRPEDPIVYRIFGVGVVSPCDGEIVKVVDGLQDMRVPEYDRQNMAGNHIIISCFGAHVVLAHLRRGSVSVRPRDLVRAGTPLAEVGNSGGSDEPHLHIHAQRPGTLEQPMSADPIPMRINGRYLSRGAIVRSIGESR